MNDGWWWVKRKHFSIEFQFPYLTMGRGAGLVSGSNYNEKKGNKRRKWYRDSLSLSFFHSFILFCHGSRRCGVDDGGGGGTGRRCSSSSCCSRSRCWLAGWLVPPPFFLAAQVSILLHLVCMICKFVLAVQISILLRLVWCIIFISSQLTERKNKKKQEE